mgnify:CR=1 FL=1
MTKLKHIAFLLASLLLLTNCAKRGTITGGDKDTIAPKIIYSSPDNFSTNFKGNEIKINFDELIKIKDINKQLIISPPMKKQPIIVPQGSASKFISIKILDTLHYKTAISVSQYFHQTRTKMFFRKQGFHNIESASPNYFECRDFYAIFREFFAYYKEVF